MGLLDGKVAVITGAGSGMGRASCEVFVREGAKVVAADISGREKDTAIALGANVLPVHCDVTQEADVEAMIRAAVEEFGRVDAVLNVAGIAGAAMLADVTTEHYDRFMEVDLRGVFLGTKHGIRAMLEAGHGGAIVNWSSLAGLGAAPATSVYSAAKAGVISFTKAAAVEYGGKGIRANCLCPGFIHTEMSAGGEKHARHPREGGAGPRRPAGGGRRGRRVPRVGPRLLRQRGDHPRRRRVGREARLRQARSARSEPQASEGRC